MAETKYGKYIVTKPKANIARTDWGRETTAPQRLTRVMYLDDEVIKGAFYVECAWFLKGTDVEAPLPHTHDFDEVLGFFGTNPEEPENLYGEIDIWLGDEKHTLTKSCLVFIPKGLKHCPLVIRKVDRPIFHFSTGPGGMYTGEKK
jgi:mannose-6-phosphate isomerase-like protein (cupin superfamily)